MSSRLQRTSRKQIAGRDTKAYWQYSSLWLKKFPNLISLKLSNKTNEHILFALLHVCSWSNDLVLMDIFSKTFIGMYFYSCYNSLPRDNGAFDCFPSTVSFKKRIESRRESNSNKTQIYLDSIMEAKTNWIEWHGSKDKFSSSLLPWLSPGRLKAYLKLIISLMSAMKLTQLMGRAFEECSKAKQVDFFCSVKQRGPVTRFGLK